MARLNDYAAPAESIEALKRRFVRQNREIARVNSLQSLRIRSLESEVSHLLSENVSLREQVINLAQETERLEAGKLLHTGIHDIKCKLETKLAELSSLTTELGSLPKSVGKLCNERPDRPKQATESRPRAEDLTGGEDGRLPAIAEDKHYPRRTLEPQEIDSLVNDDNSILDSPPQFSFISEEADRFIEQPSPSTPEIAFTGQIVNDIAEEPESLLPPTLETRKKKKKKSSLLVAPETSPVLIDRRTTSSIDSNQNMTSISTKRKYVPEDDDRFESNMDVDDEFQFTRPSNTPNKQTNPLEIARRNQSPIKPQVEKSKESSTPVMSMRKVLEPKSTNATFTSPKKARMSSDQSPKVTQRPTKGDENTNSPQKGKGVEKLGGKTINLKPCVSRAFPSTKEKRTSQSTPVRMKEAAISLQPTLSPRPNALKTEEESGVRPSRRRGTVVSYAEPNLRDKMRRPTKEMIDAVALGSRRSSSFQSGRPSLDSGESQGHAQPQSDLLDDSSHLFHTCDLDSKDSSSEQSLATVSRRKRKVSSTTKDNIDGGSSSLDLQKEIEDSLATISSQVSQESLGSKRQTRRHSSNPKGVPAGMPQYEENQGESQSPTGDPPGDEGTFDSRLSGKMDNSQVRRGQRVAARRKSMMV